MYSRAALFIGHMYSFRAALLSLKGDLNIVYVLHPSWHKEQSREHLLRYRHSKCLVETPDCWQL